MMSKPRVVVGVDGSALAAAAVGAAAHIASNRGWDLHILHAFAPDLPMLGFGSVDDRSVVTEHGARLVAAAAARAHAAHPDLTVTTSCHNGYASQAIIAASRTSELVALGAMGHGMLSRASVGAVAMQVVTHAYSPVLVVGHENAAAPATGGRIVVGVDGSPESLRALRSAYREAGLRGASIEAVTAWQATGAEDPTLRAESSWSAFEDAFTRQVDSALTELRVEFPDVKVETTVVAKDPVLAVIEASQGAALVIVGSRGTGGFPGLHVGSTTLRLMGRTACPVLITR
jgi:nucleotide-binding universal stress UspA family protein